MKYIIILLFLFSCSKQVEIERQAKKDANYIQMLLLKDGVIDYYLIKGSLPTSLVALQDFSYIKKWKEIPLDQWGQEYIFVKVNDKEANIRSLGEDGINSKDDIKININVDGK